MLQIGSEVDRRDQFQVIKNETVNCYKNKLLLPQIDVTFLLKQHASKHLVKSHKNFRETKGFQPRSRRRNIRLIHLCLKLPKSLGYLGNDINIVTEAAFSVTFIILLNISSMINIIRP